MTVSRAKTKVCPFTVYTEKYVNPIKTYDISYETKGSNCICTKCMAWEYTKTEKETDMISLHYDEDKEITGNKNKITTSHTQISKRIYGKHRELIDERWAIMKELDENEKEGYCIRLKGL